MTEPDGTIDNPFHTENPYPMRGYIYTRDGMHDGGDELPDKTALYSWLSFIAPWPARRGQEVVVTDNMDYCAIHFKDGKLLFPTNEQLEKEVLGES